MRDLRGQGPSPDLVPPEARAAAIVEAARIGFQDPNPCAYCGATPTKVIALVPAVTEKGRIVKRAHVANLCFDCARRLRVLFPGPGDTAWKAAMIKTRETERRKANRDEMWANQNSLFNPDNGPDDALTGG